MHGYSDIPASEVTVRSEVARLTRLYDRAIRANTLNNPDLYQSDTFGGVMSGNGVNKLQKQTPQHFGELLSSQLIATGPPAGDSSGAAPVPIVPAVDPDSSPATLPTPGDVKDAAKDKKEGDDVKDVETKGKALAA